MKKLISIILLFVMSSCGYQLTKVAEQTTSTTTTSMTIATTIAVSIGQDCNHQVGFEIIRLQKEVDVAWENATNGNGGVPSRSEYDKSVSTLTSYRSYVRSLDLPTLSTEQNSLVQAIQNYLVAYNRYWESNKKDLTVNDYILPYTDAVSDFQKAFLVQC